MRSFILPLLIVAVAVLVWWLFDPEPEADVVLYCGVDQDQSQQIAQPYEKEKQLRLDYVGESEAFRSIGLPSRLKGEAAHPKADVFWSNEIMNMVDLGNQRLLAKLPEGIAAKFPPLWRDPTGQYVADRPPTAAEVAGAVSWAKLLRKVFEVDPLRCPRCGGSMAVIAWITDPATVDRILAHRRRRGIESPFESVQARAPPAA